ncbi:hypothetical protein [Flavobacterium psychrophilum]|uniref:hypothetical protein n=1 Tax=Flavobacterium psychrophilum TaxID=96345 RepID=UPI00061877DB|nr:hypothetical protein [Flavobacterium psychrophilum]OAE90380.1 hypothetical protein SU65_11610 [Flavobacterium psychrophilum]
MKTLFFLLIPLLTFSQVKMPSVPQPTQFPNYSNQNWTNPNSNLPNVPNPLDIINGTGEQQRIQQQNQQIIHETQQREIQREQQMREVSKDINQSKSNIDYYLPSSSSKFGTEYYKRVFYKMLLLDETNYSVKSVNFDIENAYFDNKLEKEEFEKTIKQTGEFLIAKMKELRYDLNSNPAKNFILFEYFSETLQLNGFKTKHFPLKYDFEDYRGDKDWSKMFVTKLLRTGKGQCHSMPLLYLTLAEEIGAEAFLSICPNHSYIKFQDEKGKWYNLELTNGMFTASSFILNSGFIKSEAMQNQIYMQNFSKKELLSQFYTDLAMGYIHKFGYDEFVNKIIQKALDLYPNNINANMVLSNYNTVRFEYAMKKLGINPTKKEELQKIRQFPETVEFLNATNEQYNKIDDLGFQQMPADAYEKWLGSLKQVKNKQQNEEFTKQFKGLVIKKQPKN